MSLALKYLESNITQDSGVFIFTVASAGIFKVSTSSTMGVQPSSVAITIAQAGSASVSVSSPAASAAQYHLELMGVFNCAVSDTLTVTITSSDPQNTLKTLIAVTNNI